MPIKEVQTYIFGTVTLKLLLHSNALAVIFLADRIWQKLMKGLNYGEEGLFVVLTILTQVACVSLSSTAA